MCLLKGNILLKIESNSPRHTENIINFLKTSQKPFKCHFFYCFTVVVETEQNTSMSNFLVTTKKTAAEYIELLLKSNQTFVYFLLVLCNVNNCENNWMAITPFISMVYKIDTLFKSGLCVSFHLFLLMRIYRKTTCETRICYENLNEGQNTIFYFLFLFLVINKSVKVVDWGFIFPL